jgi:hypothetical protein
MAAVIRMTRRARHPCWVVDHVPADHHQIGPDRVYGVNRSVVSAGLPFPVLDAGAPGRPSSDYPTRRRSGPLGRGSEPLIGRDTR